MPPEVALPAAFAVAALSTAALTPAAILLAVATNFLDRPVGYKGHARPTPYLGGVALAGGVSIAALVFGAAAATYAVLLCCSLGLWAVGTLDDRRNLSPLTRVVAEIGVGLVLWGTGLGWDLLGSAAADALLTVLWVVGVVNAFNLMDNMNGAATTTAGISALGAAGLALGGGDAVLAALCLTIAGACAGFLPFNLARPSRIFMGDGGSMLLGSLVASVAMSTASIAAVGPSAVIVAALVAGLAILDTALVMVSRRRGGRPLLSGGRDHLTHRLARRLGSAQRVPLALAGGQAVLCAVAVASAEAGAAWVIGAGAACAAAGIYAISRLESPVWFDARQASRGRPGLPPTIPQQSSRSAPRKHEPWPSDHNRGAPSAHRLSSRRGRTQRRENSHRNDRTRGTSMGLMPGRLTAVANGRSSKRAKPHARTEGLVVEELGDELLVYDRSVAQAHSLSATATSVWRACDGQTTVEALGRDLQLDPQALRRALDELRDCKLLDDGPQRQANAGMTRRDMTMRTARLGVAAASVPLIYSVAVPATAAATPTLAQCFQYTDKDCDGCTSICGCCCCCAASNCKTCAPVNLCSTVGCTGGSEATGNCTTIAKDPPDCTPADTIPLPPCKPPNAAQVERPCCNP